MKQTVTLHGFRDAFAAIRPDNFSHEGLELLFDWFEELDEEMELDVIAICCDWAECDPDEIMGDYDISLDALGLDDDADEDEIADALVEYLNEQTMVAGKTDANTIVYCSW